MSQPQEEHCDRCRGPHEEGKARWRCTACARIFCAMDLVNGKRWNHRGLLHVGMTRSGTFRVCGSMVKEAQVDASEAAATAPDVPGVPGDVQAETAQSETLQTEV